MNRILTKCWHSITLRSPNCCMTPCIKLYIWKAKQYQLYAVQYNTTYCILYYAYTNVKCSYFYLFVPHNYVFNKTIMTS